MSIIASWYVERFHREKRLKSPGHYIAELKPKKQQTAADVLAIFEGFKASGLPVNIKKLN